MATDIITTQIHKFPILIMIVEVQIILSKEDQVLVLIIEDEIRATYQIQEVIHKDRISTLEAKVTVEVEVIQVTVIIKQQLLAISVGNAYDMVTSQGNVQTRFRDKEV